MLSLVQSRCSTTSLGPVEMMAELLKQLPVCNINSEAQFVGISAHL
jgi:hypothetical protein